MNQKEMRKQLEFMEAGIFETMLENGKVNKRLPSGPTISGDPFKFNQGDIVYIVTNVTKAVSLFSKSKFKENADFDFLQCEKRKFYKFDDATKRYTFVTVSKDLNAVKDKSFFINATYPNLSEITVDDIIKKYTLYVDSTKLAVSTNPVIAPIDAGQMSSSVTIAGGRRSRKRGSRRPKSKKSRKTRKSRR